MPSYSSSTRSSVRAAGGQVRSELEIDGAAFMRSLAAQVAQLEIRTEAALWSLGLRIQNNARILAPVDTGRLRSSIQAHKEPRAVVIGTNVEYAAYVEFGTRFMAAQPYLRPAVAVGVAQWNAGIVKATGGLTG